MKTENNKETIVTKGNIYTSREEWLRAATNELRSYFEMFGYPIPDNIRFAIAFTSGGKRGMEGECWNPAASADGHHELIIKADKADPLEILGILTRELIHTLLPPDVKYGRQFRDIALRIGLEGKMTQATPTPALQERLKSIAAALGPIPHAVLNYGAGNSRKKKQGVRMLKAECGAACGYTVRIIPKWAKVGLPVCPVDAAHGPLRCDLPEEE